MPMTDQAARRRGAFRFTLPTVAMAVTGDAGAPAGDSPGTSSEPLTLEGLAVPWGVTAPMNGWGDTITFGAGSLEVPDPGRVKLCLDHRDKPFGYGVSFTNTAEGLHAVMAIPRDELADPEVAAAVRQHRNGVRDALSVGVHILDAAEEWVGEGWDATCAYTVTAGRLLELSSVVVPRFDDARAARIAASASTPTPGGVPMTMTAPALGPEPTEPVPPVPPQPGPDDPNGPDARMVAHAAALTATRHTSSSPAPVRGRFPSFGAFALAHYRGEIDAAYQNIVRAAWTDQLTTDVPGLMPEQWVGEVVALMAAVQPTVRLFSRRPLPDDGMVIHQPVVNQYPDVGLVPAEKTEIPSRKVLIGQGDFPVETFAGGQDVSIQTITRSSPDYIDVLMRLYAQQMGLELNIAQVGKLIAGTTATSPVDPADLNGTFIDAAAVILAATYAFPQVLVMGVNWWIAAGKATGTDGRPLFPHMSPVNPLGTFALDEGDGNVRGLDYAVDPSMEPNTAVMGLRDAFRTWEGTIGTLAVDVPRLLGRDVAVYQFAAGGVTDGRGLVKMVGTFPAVAGTTERTSSTTTKRSSSSA